MTTTKTLVDLKAEGIKTLGAGWESASEDQIESFTEKVWNAALDACKEKATEADLHTFSDGHIYGGDKMRDLILEAIDSLRV